jgi:restriction endonuclease
MVMARDQNAGRNHSMKIDNSSTERVEEFKYLGTTLTNQNSIQAEIKSRLDLLFIITKVSHKTQLVTLTILSLATCFGCSNKLHF